MSVIALCSASGSPGVTTTAVAMAVNWPHSLGAEAARLDRLPPPSTEMSEDERAAALRKQENMRAFYDHLEGN